MIKAILIFGLVVSCLNVVPQKYCKCNVVVFKRDFLYFPHTFVNRLVFHYASEKHYRPNEYRERVTDEYHYLHNGDNLKGTKDILTGDLQGSDWLKEFDFGKFATVIIEISGEPKSNHEGVFTWSGNLTFFKLVKKKRLRV